MNKKDSILSSETLLNEILHQKFTHITVLIIPMSFLLGFVHIEDTFIFWVFFPVLFARDYKRILLRIWTLKIKIWDRKEIIVLNVHLELFLRKKIISSMSMDKIFLIIYSGARFVLLLELRIGLIFIHFIL